MEPNEMNQNPETTAQAEGQSGAKFPEMPDVKKIVPKKSVGREILEWIGSLAAALVIVFLIQNFLFTLIRVDGHSMDTTLADGERLFVTVADVKFGSVSRDDVVICHYPGRGRTFFVKRVVGVPGDKVYRENGVTHVIAVCTDKNGETVNVDHPLDAPFVNIFYDPADDYAPYELGENEYFVVGDNRGNSHDSRDWNDSDPSRDVGPITKDMITGHVRCVLWPFGSIRSIK